MTIDEAIKIIQKDIDDDDVEWGSPLGEAYKLSYEALKALKQHRELDICYACKPLPGETEE